MGQLIDELELLPPREDIHCDEEHTEEQPQILAELVIEEVGIDGMCGVY